jgi:acetyl-CoA C-acetyltransferase
VPAVSVKRVQFTAFSEAIVANPNTPVIVGVGQFLQRDPESAVEPVEMMLKAAALAAADADAPSLLTRLDAVGVVRGLWRYANPARYVADRVGSPTAETIGTPFGGNMVQKMLQGACVDVLAGRKSAVLLTGAENGNSQAKARKRGAKLAERACPGDYDRLVEDDKPMAGPAELARGIRRAVQVYPIFENAIRYARGESIDEHRDRIAALWSRFSRVAAVNPHAWLPAEMDAGSIRDPSSTNRWVSFPYPKLMNANNAVDMAAAIIVCSRAFADEHGVPQHQRVYPWAGTGANDHAFVSDRDNLHTSPAIRLAGARVLDMVDLSVDQIAHIDLYSCFPSAVQVAAHELGIPEDRDLTVTGGLTFGGGPLNNYVMHSMARTVELCRQTPSSCGLVTANGGYLTKHAIGIYSTDEPERDFQYEDVQPEVDRTFKRASVVDHAGSANIESYTVMFGDGRPVVAHASCLTPDGTRTFANCADAALLEAMTHQEFCGVAVTIDGAGEFRPTG